ncbi:MAG: hypothetical protein ACYDAD_06220 [Acidimicrobiales bacterium]
MLGGEDVMSAALAARVSAMGYTVVRYGRTNRFGTAAQIADQGLGTRRR